MGRRFSLAISLIISASLYSSAASGEVKRLSFTGLDLPGADNEKTSPRVSPKARVTYGGGEAREVAPEFRVIARSGDQDKAGGVFGLLHDKSGRALEGPAGEAPSNMPDGNTVLKRGERLFLLTNFEGYPGSVYLTELRKKGDSLWAYSFRDVDFSGVNGTAVNCASSRTPWDTHLTGEEDFAFDAIYFDKATRPYAPQHLDKCYDSPGFICSAVEAMAAYNNGRYNLNPYDYGHIVEVSLDSKGRVKPSKRLALGKFSPELAVVLPDERTVYMTDDGAYGGLFMFVAEKPKDLSSGTLYMAKWDQTSDSEGGSANISWVRLGSGSEAKIRELINKKPVFTDIFDIADPSSCPEGFRLVKAGLPSAQCLRLRDGENGASVSKKFKNASEAQMAAAFLESRRYGAWLGATAEFRKEEGLAYDPAGRTLYVAITSIDKSMEAGPADPQDHIRLSKNRCGAVYALKLGEDVEKNSSYVASEMKAVLTGKPLSVSDENGKVYGCHPDFIANPDNLGFVKNLLFIGEDSDYHLNNMVWAYDPEKKALTRVMTLPTGAESTGSFSHIEADGNLYIFTNIQHPLAEGAMNGANRVVNAEFLRSADDHEKRGYLGYIIIPGKSR